MSSSLLVLNNNNERVCGIRQEETLHLISNSPFDPKALTQQIRRENLAVNQSEVISNCRGLFQSGLTNSTPSSLSLSLVKKVVPTSRIFSYLHKDIIFVGLTKMPLDL